MNIYECKRQAIEMNSDNVVFDMVTPSGKSVCKWKDVHFGIFNFTDPEKDRGFLRADDIHVSYPDLEYENLRVKEG